MSDSTKLASNAHTAVAEAVLTKGCVDLDLEEGDEGVCGTGVQRHADVRNVPEKISSVVVGKIVTGSRMETIHVHRLNWMKR